MTKNPFLKGGVLLLLSLMFSCDNTTADPINQNNNAGASGNSSTPTITGPRILHKVIANNETNEEYVTNGNILQKAIFKETSGPTSFFVGTVTYTSGKISKVKFAQEVNGVVPANSLNYDFNITYDSSGKINYTTCATSLGTVPNFNNEYTYTYDGSGKMTKIVEKKKSGANYASYTNYNFTNTGDNITKIISETGPTSPTGVPDTSAPVITTIYNYTAYDSKINPHTTLPKTFFVMWSLVHPANFWYLSANNVTSFNMEALSPASPTPVQVLSGNFMYLYDSMNYPTSDQSQSRKYIYKAL